MNIKEYKSHLTALLRSLPAEEREEAVSFYMESIADRIDEGMSEEEAVASIASPGQAAEAIIAEAGEKKKTLVSFEISAGDGAPDFPEEVTGIERVESIYVEESGEDEQGEEASTSSEGFFARAKKRRFTPLEWVALIVTSPLWLALVIAAAACVLALVISIAAIALALYICAWALIACIWIIGGAFVISSPAVLVFAVWGLQTGNLPYSMVNIGYSLVLFGSGMWILKAALAVTRAFLRWQKKNVVVVVVQFPKRGNKFAEEVDLVDAPNVAEQTRSADGASKEGDEGALMDGVLVESLDGDSADVSSAAAHARSYALFFRICWILAAAGFVCVLFGFLASGLDWRVFLSSNFSDGKVYLGGMEVAHPEQLFLSPHFWTEVVTGR